MSVSVRIGGISTSVLVRRIGDAMEWWMEEPSVVLLFVPLGISPDCDQETRATDSVLKTVSSWETNLALHE